MNYQPGSLIAQPKRPLSDSAPDEPAQGIRQQNQSGAMSWSTALDLWLLAEILTLSTLAVVTSLLLPDRASNSPHVPVVAVVWLATYLTLRWSKRATELTRQQAGAVRSRLSDWVKSALVVVVFCYFSQLTEEVPRLWAASLLAGGLVTIGLVGASAKAVTLSLAEKGTLGSRIAIYGCGEGIAELIDYIGADSNPAARVERLFDERAGRGEKFVHGHEISTDIEELITLAKARSIDAVMLNLPWSAYDRIGQLVHRLERVNIDILMAPSLIQIKTRSRSVAYVGSIPTVSLYRRPISGAQALGKLLLDRVVSALGLALLSPFLVLIGILIKLDSQGPVLFRQMRRGLNNEPFEMLKFRSMYTHAEDANGQKLVTPGDSRVTRVGAILRRTSLDELPQLYNVLVGEMSLVGPRPHLWEAKAVDRRYEEIVRRYPARHRVLPGITGLAQVRGYRGNGDDETAIIKRVESDLEYMDRWSLSLDVSILVRTALTVLLQRGVY
jgi:polysaccharide biosynthesis protein PslA